VGSSFSGSSFGGSNFGGNTVSGSNLAEISNLGSDLEANSFDGSHIAAINNQLVDNSSLDSSSDDIPPPPRVSNPVLSPLPPNQDEFLNNVLTHNLFRHDVEHLRSKKPLDF